MVPRSSARASARPSDGTYHQREDRFFVVSTLYSSLKSIPSLDAEWDVGVAVGRDVGTADGNGVGTPVGVDVGVTEGVAVGTYVGRDVGSRDGSGDG